MNFFQKSKFKLFKIVKMAVLDLKSAKVISRKIWVAEKSRIFHIVYSQ